MMGLSLSLEGRHTLVCGASAGIGRACAMAMASQGASVTVLARRAELLEALVGQLRSAGAPAAYALAADLDDREKAIARVGHHVAEHGPIHILLNNAGGPPAGPLLDADEAAFVAGMGRHVLAAQQLTRLMLPGMREAGYGRIINIISTSVREPIDNLGVSNTVRGAMAAWAKTLSRELPPGITVNNVLPGFTDTERLSALRTAVAKRSGKSEDQVLSQWLAAIPEGRLARAEEIAAAVVFFASPAAAYIRGHSLPVDGGRMHSI